MDLNYDAMVNYDASFADGQLKKTVSNTRLLDAYKRITGKDCDFVPLDQGLSDTVQWFLKNYPISEGDGMVLHAVSFNHLISRSPAPAMYLCQL